MTVIMAVNWTVSLTVNNTVKYTVVNTVQVTVGFAVFTTVGRTGGDTVARAKNENKKILQLYPSLRIHALLENIAEEERRSKTQMSEILLEIATLNYEALVAADKARREG